MPTPPPASSATPADASEWSVWRRHISTQQWAAVALLMAVAVWVRWHELDAPMRYDESYTVVNYVASGFLHVVGNYRLPNNHVFHTLLVYGVSLFAGMEPWVVRLPAFVAGAAQVPALFLVFSRLRDTTAGLLAAAMAAGSSALLHFSVNARGYTIAGLLAVVAVGVAAEHRARGSDRSRLLALSAVAAFGLWTVPVFAYPWAGVLLWLLLPDGRTTGSARLTDAVFTGVASIVGAAVLYTPALVASGPAALLSNRFVAPDPLPEFVERLPRFLEDVARMWTHEAPIAVIALALLGVVVALLSPRAVAVRSLAWSLLLGVSVLLVGQHVIPYPRTWTVLLPLWIGIAASGLTVVLGRLTGPDARMSWAPVLGSLGLAGWLAVSIQASATPLPGEDIGLPHAEEITIDLVDRLSPSGYVAAEIPSTAPLRYYFVLHGLPPGQVLDRPDSPPETLYVVTTSDQTVDEVLEELELEASTAPTPVSSYPSGSLWRTDVHAR